MDRNRSDFVAHNSLIRTVPAWQLASTCKRAAPAKGWLRRLLGL
jgi:hypothetical protein